METSWEACYPVLDFGLLSERRAIVRAFPQIEIVSEPRPSNDDGWQTDVDNRIRFGLRKALDLGVVRKGDTVIDVQGWRSGGNHTSKNK